MDILFWVIGLIIPVAMAIAGFVLKKHPPEYQAKFGLRTKRSMASEDNWALAQELCGDAWFLGGIMLAVIVVTGYLLVPAASWLLCIVNVGMSLLTILITIIMVQRVLKEKMNGPK